MNRDAFLEDEMLDGGRVYAFEHPVHGGIRIVGDLVHLERPVVGAPWKGAGARRAHPRGPG